MRIVLKPLGIIAIAGAIILLALLAFRNSAQRGTAASKSPSSGVVPSMSDARAAAVSSELAVYTDGLESGWMERGWAKVIDYAAASPIRGNAGTSIRVEAAPFEAVKIYNPSANLSFYKYLVFFVHGGSGGGQLLTVATVAKGETQKSVALPPLPANKWARVILPLSELGIQGRGDVHAFWVQSASTTPMVFHLDDIQFRTTPPDNVTEETLTLAAAAPMTTTP